MCLCVYTSNALDSSFLVVKVVNLLRHERKYYELCGWEKYDRIGMIKGYSHDGFMHSIRYLILALLMYLTIVLENNTFNIEFL